MGYYIDENYYCAACGSHSHKCDDETGFCYECGADDWEPEPEETDYRRTVYWNPQVKTDTNGRAHVEFYNNGFSRRLAVSAEGITANGQPIMNSK